MPSLRSARPNSKPARCSPKVLRHGSPMAARCESPRDPRVPSCWSGPPRNGGPAVPYAGEMEMHFATVWESLADELGDQLALIHGETRRTWTEYDERAARLAAAFAAAGLAPDAKVGLYLYNGPEYLEAQYGAMK